MVIPEGYKKTEIGIIPEDWDIGTVESFGFVVSGGTPSTTNSLYWNGNICWCTPTDIKATTTPKLCHTQKFITEKGLADSSAVLLPINSIMICTRATIGEIRINGLPMATNQGFKNIIVKNGDYLYLYYILTTKKQKMIKLSYGTTFLELSKKALCTIPIQIPKASEQHAISNALYDIDILIDNLEKLIVKKKNIKQGAMQELLTGKRRLHGFDGEWETISIGESCDSIGGGTPSKQNVEWWQGDIPWISSSDLSENDIYRISVSRYISREALIHSSTKLCPANCILLVSRVGIGKVAIAYTEICTSQDFTNLIPKYHDPVFLAYYLSRIMKEKSGSQGTSIKGITTTDISKIKVVLPKREEQEAIVSILSDMDNEIDELEKKLTKYRCLKQGMMSELLSGHIRLTEKEGA